MVVFSLKGALTVLLLLLVENFDLPHATHTTSFQSIRTILTLPIQCVCRSTTDDVASSTSSCMAQKQKKSAVISRRAVNFFTHKVCGSSPLSAVKSNGQPAAFNLHQSARFYSSAPLSFFALGVAACLLRGLRRLPRDRVLLPKGTVGDQGPAGRRGER